MGGAVPVRVAGSAHERRADRPVDDDNEPLEGSPWDNDRVVGAARCFPAEFSAAAPRTGRVSGWETETFFEVEVGTFVEEPCTINGIRP